MSDPRGSLNAVCSELSSIISELDDIAAGVARDFTGIGNERCAQSISSVSGQCAYARQRLYSVDTSVVTAEFAAAHGMTEE